MIYDREATLAAIDRGEMVRLADELLGAHRGSDRSPMWSCPSPGHLGQTGRTPPVSIFTDRLGGQRWKCHACGAGGTAIDLVMQATGATVRQALGDLARRTGTGLLRSLPSPGRRARLPPAARDPFQFQGVPELDRYVDGCAAALWRPDGRGVRRWLMDVRGLPEQVLEANRIGLDLGAARQERPDGVPRVRRAVVLPVLASGGACFVQLRMLNTEPGFSKYLNPHEWFAPNPRLGLFAPKPAPALAGAVERKELIVTEGIFDALAATSAGYRAAACLGAGYPHQAVALALARLSGPLVVAFDPDPAGRSGSQRLVELLAAQRREVAVLRLTTGDLNSHAAKSGDWPVELAARVDQATYSLRQVHPDLVLGIG